MNQPTSVVVSSTTSSSPESRLMSLVRIFTAGPGASLAHDGGQGNSMLTHVAWKADSYRVWPGMSGRACPLYPLNLTWPLPGPVGTA